MELDQWHMWYDIHINNFHEDTKVHIVLHKSEKLNLRKAYKSCVMRRIEDSKFVVYCLVRDA